ncbi:hypothetical protein BDZ45DRAFT_114581 [Acephala macrosclerotiorum]|nr:hypothetical protein BDZ45DRAFT_114581 [Acephala macrosclerotiorum]
MTHRPDPNSHQAKAKTKHRTNLINYTHLILALRRLQSSPLLLLYLLRDHLVLSPQIRAQNILHNRDYKQQGDNKKPLLRDRQFRILVRFLFMKKEKSFKEKEWEDVMMVPFEKREKIDGDILSMMIDMQVEQVAHFFGSEFLIHKLQHLVSMVL